MRKPKDHRNGQFSGVECSSLNPAPSFLLLFCGKKVGGKIFIQLCFFFHLHFDTSFGLLSVRGKVMKIKHIETEASKICHRSLSKVIAAKASNAFGAWKAALPTFA